MISKKTLIDAVDAALGIKHHRGIAQVMVRRLEDAQTPWSYKKRVGLSYARLKWHTTYCLTDKERGKVWAIFHHLCPAVAVDGDEVFLGTPW